MELVKQTCTKMMINEILEINDVRTKNTPRPLITLNTSSGLTCKWLFDTGAAITCMSIGAFRKIPIDKRPTKINDKGRECRGASGTSLIPVGTYLMSLEWDNKKILHPVTVFQNLNTPLIMGIDAIHHMGITYLTMSETFMFQDDIVGQNKFRKADLMTVQKSLYQLELASQ